MSAPMLSLVDIPATSPAAAARALDLHESLAHTVGIAPQDEPRYATMAPFIAEWGWVLASEARWGAPHGFPRRDIGEGVPGYLLRVGRAVLVAAQRTPEGRHLTEQDLPFIRLPSPDARRLTQAMTWVNEQPRMIVHRDGVPTARDLTEAERRPLVERAAALFLELSMRGRSGLPVILDNFVEALELRGADVVTSGRRMLEDPSLGFRSLEAHDANAVLDGWLERGIGRTSPSRLDPATAPTRGHVAAHAAAYEFWRLRFAATKRVQPKDIVAFLLRFPDRIDREGRVLVWGCYQRKLSHVVSAQTAERRAPLIADADAFVAWYEAFAAALTTPGPAFAALVDEYAATDPTGVVELLSFAPDSFTTLVSRATLATLLHTAAPEAKLKAVTLAARIERVTAVAHAATQRGARR
jgi:hypothetical protein